MRLSAKQLKEIIQKPEEYIDMANLVYINDHDLCITRHKHGRGFYYKDKSGQKIIDADEKKRIKSLAIPPNWKKVRISEIKNGHLQAVGRDDKERKVYLYHESWTRFKNQTKFYKMLAFGHQLSKIRKQVEKDLSLKGMPKQKVIALVIRLMEETHIRIGNHYYAQKNKTYGLSTLRSKHINISQDLMELNFIGKKGKEHHIEITDKNLIELVQNCEEIPGWEVFKYYDKDGNKQVIDSGLVNEYIQKSCGEFFSAKDFRTWAATKIYFETLKDFDVTKDEKTQQKNIIVALDEAAEALGNTRSVCREYYVHPVVTEKYLDGSIKKYFDKIDNQKEHQNSDLSNTEKLMIELMKDFELDL